MTANGDPTTENGDPAAGGEYSATQRRSPFNQREPGAAFRANTLDSRPGFPLGISRSDLRAIFEPGLKSQGVSCRLAFVNFHHDAHSHRSSRYFRYKVLSMSLTINFNFSMPSSLLSITCASTAVVNQSLRLNDLYLIIFAVHVPLAISRFVTVWDFFYPDHHHVPLREYQSPPMRTQSKEEVNAGAVIGEEDALGTPAHYPPLFARRLLTADRLFLQARLITCCLTIIAYRSSLLYSNHSRPIARNSPLSAHSNAQTIITSDCRVSIARSVSINH